MSEPSATARDAGENDAPDFSAFARAVERGRLLWSLPRAAVAAAAAVPAVVAGASWWQAAVLGVVLFAAATFAGWRSRAGLLGALAGVAVAAVPLVMGPLMAGRCHCAGGLCLSWCAVGCGLCAVAVGVAAGWAFSRIDAAPAAWRVDFAAAAVVCSAVGLLLCPISGLGSVTGALVGAVVGFSPAVVWRVARAA